MQPDCISRKKLGGNVTIRNQNMANNKRSEERVQVKITKRQNRAFKLYSSRNGRARGK